MEIETVHQTCCHTGCGIDFWITKGLNDLRLKDHLRFYCPNGHSQSYIGETETQKYKRLYIEEQSKTIELNKKLAQKAKPKTKRKPVTKKLVKGK